MNLDLKVAEQRTMERLRASKRFARLEHLPELTLFQTLQSPRGLFASLPSGRWGLRQVSI